MTKHTLDSSVADNKYYQDHILKLIKAGHGELYVLKSLLELMHVMGQVDLDQYARYMTEQELLRIEGMGFD